MSHGEQEIIHRLSRSKQEGWERGKGRSRKMRRTAAAAAVAAATQEEEG